MTREHIEHILAALGALAFALFISYFNSGVHAVTIETIAKPHATLVSLGSSTPDFAPDLFPNLLIPTSTFEVAPATTTTVSPAKPTATKPPARTPIPAPKISVPEPKPPVPESATTAPATSTAPTNASPLLATLAKSIVNIICLSNGSLHSISGSGVIIDSRGIILTVAHVAQSLLLEEYLGADTVSCVIRTGSPARSTYTAKLIYISSPWVHANSTTLISSQPTGTGENDFAFLAITGTVNGAALPSSFPAVALSDSEVSTGNTVGIGSYGAQDLTVTQVRTSLYPTLVTSEVRDRYTFDTNTVDVLSIAGSAASQEGSSGGAIVNQDGRLVGLITTSETTGSESSRELRAITTTYIRRSFNGNTGKDLDSYLESESPAALADSYAETIQVLGQFLAKAIGVSH